MRTFQFNEVCSSCKSNKKFLTSILSFIEGILKQVKDKKLN
jgi:hypothetical protein